MVSQVNQTRRLLLKGGASLAANAMFPAAVVLLPGPQALLQVSTGGTVAATVTTVPDCVYSALFEQPHIRSLRLHDNMSPVLADKAHIWWDRAENEYADKTECKFIEDTVKGILSQQDQPPEFYEFIRKNFIKSIKSHFGYQIKRQLQAYSLDAQTLQDIQKTEMWQRCRRESTTGFINVHVIDHEFFASRLMNHVQIMTDLFDVADRRLPPEKISKTETLNALDSIVYDTIRDLSTTIYTKQDISIEEADKAFAEAEAESLALVRRMTEQEKIEFLMESESYYSGVFRVPEELGPLLPKRTNISIRKFMFADSEFIAQSPQSYAAMEERIKHLRERVTGFFNSRMIADIADNVTHDGLLNHAAVRASAVAQSLAAGINAVFRKGAAVITAKINTPVASEGVGTPALEYQRQDDLTVDLGAATTQAATVKKEFVPR